MTDTTQDYSTIEREMYVDAPPHHVFAVVSRPEHIVGWWSDEAELDPSPGASGFVAFGDIGAGGKRVEITIDEAVPDRLFAFRWTHVPEAQPTPGNSNLVTFELSPEGPGTRLHFRETGFTQRSLDPSEVEALHTDHSRGWDHFLPRLQAYAARVGD